MHRSDPLDAGRPGRRWQDVVLAAQRDLANAITPAIGDGRLDRHSYRGWMEAEAALCRLNAAAMDTLSAWHGGQPTQRSTAQGWATAMRADALAAAADARRIGIVAGVLPPQLGAWQAFLASACGSARAGEALGAVVLHSRVMRGPMREVIAAIAALPFASGLGCGYLLQRREPETTPEQQGRTALLDAYSSTALAAGAHRAADWYRAALASVLSADAHATHHLSTSNTRGLP